MVLEFQPNIVKTGDTHTIGLQPIVLEFQPNSVKTGDAYHRASSPRSELPFLQNLRRRTRCALITGDGAPNYFSSSSAFEIRLYCRGGVALLTHPEMNAALNASLRRGSGPGRTQFREKATVLQLRPGLRRGAVLQAISFRAICRNYHVMASNRSGKTMVFQALTYLPRRIQSEEHNAPISLHSNHWAFAQ